MPQKSRRNNQTSRRSRSAVQLPQMQRGNHCDSHWRFKFACDLLNFFQIGRIPFHLECSRARVERSHRRQRGHRRHRWPNGRGGCPRRLQHARAIRGSRTERRRMSSEQQLVRFLRGPGRPHSPWSHRHERGGHTGDAHAVGTMRAPYAVRNRSGNNPGSHAAPGGR